MPAQFRVVTMPSGKGWTPWRDTKEETIEEAIGVELAERDEADPTKLYWDPLAMIEMRDGRGGSDLLRPQ